MEGTLQTIDRLIEGMNGEDPGGARIYMSQLQENEVGVCPNFKKHHVVYQSMVKPRVSALSTLPNALSNVAF